MPHRLLAVIFLGLSVLMVGCSDRTAPEGVQSIRIGDQDYVAYPVDMDAEMTPEEAQARANEIGVPNWYRWLGVRRSMDRWLIPAGLIAQVLALLGLLIESRTGGKRRDGHLGASGWIGGVASVVLLLYFLLRIEPVGVLAMAVMSLIFLGQITGGRVKSAREEQDKGVRVSRKKTESVATRHPSEKSDKKDAPKDDARE